MSTRHRSLYIISIGVYYNINVLGYVPIDGIPRTEVATISVPVAIVFIFVEACGLVFAIVCLLFNFIFRNKRYFALSFETFVRIKYIT